MTFFYLGPPRSFPSLLCQKYRPHFFLSASLCPQFSLHSVIHRFLLFPSGPSFKIRNSLTQTYDFLFYGILSIIFVLSGASHPQNLHPLGWRQIHLYTHRHIHLCGFGGDQKLIRWKWGFSKFSLFTVSRLFLFMYLVMHTHIPDWFWNWDQRDLVRDGGSKRWAFWVLFVYHFFPSLGFSRI